MNLGIKYDNNINRYNTSDCIAGVESEENKVSNTGTKNLSYKKSVRTGSEKKR